MAAFHSLGAIFHVALILNVFAGTARAGDIWQWTHEASGSASSNLFDGGPVISRSDQTKGFDDDDMVSFATDITVTGTSGASTSASTRSSVNEFKGATLNLMVNLRASYIPSFQPGGDNPGGWAEAELESVIEFVVPEGEVIGEYAFEISNDHPTQFNGSSHLLLENLTQSRVILEFSEPQFTVGDIDLEANAGDVIRLTTISQGSGSVGPGSARKYLMFAQLEFAVPEPSTLVMLGLGMLMAGSPTRRRKPETR